MVEEELGNDENGLNSHQDDLLSESKEFFEINDLMNYFFNL